MQTFARYDGLLLALLWTLSFACYIIGFGIPTVSIIALVLALATPFFALHRLRVYRDYGRDGIISFRRAWAYVFFSFFYASLLFALVQFAYFAYLDKGYFVHMIQQLIDAPENQQVLSQYATKESFDQMIRDIQAVRPIDLALSMLQANVFVSVLLGIPMAAVVCRSKAKATNK